MKPDTMLRSDIVAELNFDSAIIATDVGVTVKDWAVTLTGHPSSYAKMYAVERSVQRIKGVKALTIEMQVRLASDHKGTDADIA